MNVVWGIVMMAIGVLFVYESREAALEAYPGAPLLQMWDDTWAQKPGVEPLAAHAVMLLAAQAMDPKDTRRPGTCELCGRPMADVRRVQFRKPCRSGYFDEVKEACRSCRTRRAGNWRYAQDGE